MNNNSTSPRNDEESEMLKTTIRIEAERLKQLMVPRLKEVIRLYEKDEISYEEARDRVESLRKEYKEK